MAAGGTAGGVTAAAAPDLIAAVRATGDDGLLRAALHYQGLVASQPGNADALHALGQVAHRAGALETAAGLIEQALRHAPQRADYAGNLGNVYHDMGRLDQAIACFRRVIAAAPQAEMAHNNLGNALQQTGALEAAAESYRRAVEIKPGFVMGWSNLGVTLRKLGRPAPAIAAFEQALSLKPDFLEALVNLGTLHQQAGDPPRAIDCYERALALRPDSLVTYTKLQEIRLATGEYAAARDLARRARAIDPANQMAVASEAFARLAEGDVTGFRALYGDPALVPWEIAAPPPGYADLAAFNDALVAEILAHPSLKWVHDDYDTSRRGFVFGLLENPPPAIAAVGRLIGDRVDAHVAALDPDPAHPFLGRIPARRKLELWATVLTGGGHHPSHLHEAKWLAGTYYVRVPASTRADDPARAGWLEFDGFTHLPGLEAHADLVRRVTPAEGLLVLFPAYLMHQTAAFTGDDLRIGLSFDVVPA